MRSKRGILRTPTPTLLQHFRIPTYRTSIYCKSRIMQHYRTSQQQTTTTIELQLLYGTATVPAGLHYTKRATVKTYLICGTDSIRMTYRHDLTVVYTRTETVN